MRGCHFCGVTEKKLTRKPRLCAGCKELRYCSKTCQKKDWKNHKLTCGQELGDSQLNQAQKMCREGILEAQTHRHGNDREGEYKAYTKVAAGFQDIGLNEKAIEYFNKALDTATTLGDKTGEAYTLDYLGYSIRQFEGHSIIIISPRYC